MSTYPTLSLKNKNPAIVSSSVVVPMPQAKPEAKLPKEKGPDYTPPSNPEKVFFNSIKGKNVLIQTVLGEEIVGIFDGETKYNLFITVNEMPRCVLKHAVIQIIPGVPEIQEFPISPKP
jgi:hypothetical protein